MVDEHTAERDALLLEERQLVYGFGGFGLEYAGGVLVTNERLPVPRFNFVTNVEVARERMSAFFERALDHYFQRAIRPEFHLPVPPAPHLAGVLSNYGFRPRDEDRYLLGATDVPAAAAAHAEYEVRPAEPAERDAVVDFWSRTQEREELRRCLEVLETHPNPGERILPVLALREGRPVASALLHTYRGASGIHAVGTRRDARGEGAATAIVRAIETSLRPPGGGPLGIWADQDRLRAKLESLGFRPWARWRVYELDPAAELHLPPAAPSAGPLWRPPRPGRTDPGR